MELGLSLGDTTTTTTSTSKSSDRLITAAVTATTTTVGVEKSLGFCMALGTNPLDDHDHDDGVGDGGGDECDDEQKEKEKGVLKDVISVGSQRISSMNPPVQLDLLPSAPVLRHHTSLPWSSDNGSSEGGGSSGNAAAGRGFEVKRMGAVATEEATSSFRLEFVSYGVRNGMENNNINNKRGGFEIGNDAVVLERASSRASDEDEHGLSRKKLRLSKEQSAYLEESFKEHTTLNPKQKLALAEHLHLRPRQVEVWFQNRRARTKLKQTEVDFEYLKRCCETLTDENRRLHKELQELRALKTTSNPFYMQHPATTLTMCPSCERVATTSAAAPSLSPATLTNPAEQINSKKPRSIVFPVSSNSNHQPAAPS